VRPWRAELPLAGAGGEPVDLWRTIASHGLVSLPPAQIDEDARILEITVPLNGGARTLRVSGDVSGNALVEGIGTAAERGLALERVRHLLRLDEDLSPFYAAVASDPDLAWAASGAGRIFRSATVFEDVVKTICTTNCAWSGTVRMVGALVGELGERAPDAPAEGPAGRAFPTAAAMATADESFYRDVARAGYRGAYLRTLAATVASAELDLEQLGRATADELPDEEVERTLLALPGVGPYAAAHIMMMLGRYSRCIFDSWTRPAYAARHGLERVADAEIAARFAPYGRFAGLAFWLFITEPWLETTQPTAS
jgi:3-methyladenine DNA glycosylase/8-oxoguanine DNA glycosylase